MTITEVTFGKTFNIGQYQSERIDMTASLDETDTPEQVLSELKQRIENFHQQNHPELYSSEQTDYSNKMSLIRDYAGSDVEQLKYTPIEELLTPSQKIIAQIQQCSDLTVLKSFELLAKNNTEIKTHYDNRLNELSN